MEALFFSPTGARNDTEMGFLPKLPTSVNYPTYGSLALLDLVPPGYTAQVRFSSCCGSRGITPTEYTAVV